MEFSGRIVQTPAYVAWEDIHKLGKIQDKTIKINLFRVCLLTLMFSYQFNFQPEIPATTLTQAIRVLKFLVAGTVTVSLGVWALKAQVPLRPLPVALAIPSASATLKAWESLMYPGYPLARLAVWIPAYAS